ncbi:hypothetical protein A5750_02255 [Mycobacterium sp. 852002-51613_SCH5001154]|uniref:hypothetical protein n=1 Tax=Mycobacterium sp. 852002-51613_SCH5001154 TaxID=1834104 RepID=UPI0007FD59A4|nr:hypothetical protein [Mycobacterium sp. 852002-51613_SCH5001154]OBF71359.1 hypothetical protein A5750_02255 [Mycobacterium sp. 852002-51613_SCH5001154]
MSVQDDKSADQHTDQADEDTDQETDQKLTEKPEPDEDDKKKAAEMMEAYKEKATIVLPGTGGSVSGTAVNDWLDEDGNPRHEVPDNAGSDDQGKADQGEAETEEGRDEEALKDQIEKDKALNEKLKEAAKAENKGEKD